jgi:fucose 4-O-acetylase-like acetyltransferase
MEIMKVRDSMYDNAKFLLIFLVVLGHCIEPFITNNIVVSTVFSFIYMFHMPAFVLMSGYFAKKECNRSVLTKIFVDYFLVFLIFQLVFITFAKSIGIQKYHYLTVTPAYIYWYLFAMFAWNLILKLVIWVCDYFKIRLEYMIGGSFVLALLVGYVDSVFFCPIFF